MREFKFRAWDMMDEIMYYDAQNTCDYMGPPGIPETCFGEVLNCDGWIVMQYTGETDINKKEIYEGDIVAFKGEVYIVKYFNKYTRFALSKSKEDDELPMIVTLLKNTRVIGNIFENNWLLNEEG